MNTAELTLSHILRVGIDPVFNFLWVWGATEQAFE